MSNEYAEAVQLLAMAADELRPDDNARHEAGQQLLRDLETAAELSGCFLLQRDIDTRVFLTLPRYGRVQVACLNYGRVRVIAEDGQSHEDVELWYDASCEKLKSPERDEVITPVPGEPCPQRTAVAAVVKAALRVLRTSKRDE